MAIDQYGRFIRTSPSPRINIPVRESSFSIPRSYSTRYSRPWYASFWDRFDYVIASIGNFLADKGFSTAEWITGISVWLYAIGLIIWVIGKWSSDGFFWALLYGFGAMILFGIGCVCIGIFSWLLQLAVGALRFMFWNGVTFLAALAILAGIYFYNGSSGSSHSVSTPTETYTSAYPRYECAADVLNVRLEPTTRSSVIGVLRRGNQVEVIDTRNGFGEISYNGKTGYVSMDYLTPL